MSHLPRTGVMLFAPVRGLLLPLVLLIPLTAWAGDDEHASPPDQCPLSPPPNRSAERVVPRDERPRVEEINSRAESLAAGFRDIEAALRTLDYDPNEFPATNRSWAAVVRDDSIVVGVYEHRGNELHRLDQFGTDDMDNLSPAFAELEQALLQTPLACGSSLGALDTGIYDGARRYIYTFQLVDRSETLAWGIHFRFTVDATGLEKIDPLHFRCRTAFNRQPDASVLREAFGDRVPREELRIGETFEYVPLDDLPNESHITQLKINSIPFDVGFWTPTRYFIVRQGSTDLPVRYRWARSPCAVADD
jgi:hypothetical protein